MLRYIASMPAAPDDTAPFHRHDHDSCKAQGLASAEAHCAAAGLRLTPPRRLALDVLTAQHRAFGAYEVLEALAANGLGSQPPAAYRVLDFLTRNGLAHRIERLNAYVACAHPDRDHNPAFLICRACRTVAETPLATTRAAVGEAARDAGFRIEGLVIEALGLCPACADNAEGAPG